MTQKWCALGAAARDSPLRFQSTKQGRDLGPASHALCKLQLVTGQNTFSRDDPQWFPDWSESQQVVVTTSALHACHAPTDGFNLSCGLIRFVLPLLVPFERLSILFPGCTSWSLSSVQSNKDCDTSLLHAHNSLRSSRWSQTHPGWPLSNTQTNVRDHFFISSV